MKINCPRCGGQKCRRHDFRTYRKISLAGVEAKGYQRWFCAQCKKPFIPVQLKRKEMSPYGAEVREQATILYIDTGGSYRAVMRQLRQWGLPHVQTYQVWNWVQELGQRCVDPFIISQRLKPRWGGWLQVDGNRLRIEGMDLSILVAMDVDTRDIPCAILGQESAPNFIELFRQLRELGYPLKGCTSDGDGAIFQAFKRMYPGHLHQRCMVHFGRNLDQLLAPYRNAYPQLPKEYERFQRAYSQFASAPDWAHAKPWIQFMLHYPSFQRGAFQAARALWIRSLPQITPAFFHPGLPRTNNLIENLMRFLDRRITPMDRFHDRASAWGILKLLILFYRFHKFDNPSRPYRHIKGRSPLELAGINQGDMFWLNMGTEGENHTQRQ